MKYLMLTLLFLSACAGGKKPATTTGEKLYSSPEAKRDFCLGLAKSYTPDALQIMQANTNYKQMVSYCDGSTHNSLVKDYGTVVHEACHSYNFQIGKGTEVEGYFITDQVRITANRGALFNSSLLNGVVPAEAQKKIFRYSTYVGDKSMTSSQTKGIYGMLNEFSAYYHGTKAQVDLFDYYKLRCVPPKQDCWELYLSNPASEVYAYHEFRLFIAWYLGYAQKKLPDVYKSTMDNKPLRVAYTLIDQLYATTVQDYFKKREEMLAIFKAQGQDVRVEKGFVHFYYKDGSYHGRGGPDDDIAYLQSLLKPEDEAMLKAFAVEGVTLANYASFLKP